MARSVPAGYVQKALLYHLLELGEANLTVLVAETGVVMSSAKDAMNSLVHAGLAIKTPCAPGEALGNRSWTYGITREGAGHAMALEPADGYPDGIPAGLM
jgi:hypothetical protein